MTYHLSDLDGHLHAQTHLDPRFGGSSLALSRLAEKRAELDRALAERRRSRRETKARFGRRQPVARTA